MSESKLIIIGLSCCLLGSCIGNIYLQHKCNKLELECVNAAKLEHALREENNKLKNDVEKLEIIKDYEIDKVLAANDSTTLELWKQLLSE